MNSKINNFLEEELRHYHLEAEFLDDFSLPSFEIRNAGGRIVIAAPSAIEKLYGVYELAERFGGWCFFEPGVDRFDESRKQPVPEGIAVPAKKPLLKRRGFIQEFPFDKDTPALFDWMTKNKLNYLLVWMTYYDDLSRELKEDAALRGIEIESGHHNFSYWIPAEKYARTHPDFFAEIGGRRIEPSIGRNTLLLSEQLCTTNPELRDEILKNMVEYLDTHPEISKIALVPNDGFGWCECPRCSQFYDKNKLGEIYSVSAHVYQADRIYHDMLDDIGTRLHALRPNASLTFFAYINYCRPAPGFKLKPGLMVHFAPYWRCINHEIQDPSCDINSHYAGDIKSWAKVKEGGELNIYEYFMGVNFYLSLPMVHFREMFSELNWYRENQVDGILTQFHVTHWSVYGMNYYLMGKAARGENADEAIARMLGMLFGTRAEQARAFYREVKRVLLSAGHCHIPYPYSLLSRTKIEDFRKLGEMAGALCGDWAEKDRFFADLIIWTEFLVKFKQLFDDYHEGVLTVEMVDQFLEWIHSFRDRRLFVHRCFDSYFDACKTAIRQGTPWLHFNIDWEDRYIRMHDRDL